MKDNKKSKKERKKKEEKEGYGCSLAWHVQGPGFDHKKKKVKTQQNWRKYLRIIY
jgi:hypothetical protein